MSQKEVEVEKFEDQIENIDNPEDQAETQQNQSLNDGTIQNKSNIEGNVVSPQFDLRDEIQNSNRLKQMETPKSQSNIATPTRTASNHETSPIGQREELPQFNEGEEQSQIKLQSSPQKQEIKVEDDQNQSQEKQNKDFDQTECLPTNEEQAGENNEAEQSMHQSEKSAQSITIAKLDFLQSEIQQKDELIVTLQEEIKWLKQSQSENNEKLEEIEKKHEQKIDEMNKRILQLEKLLKEKENDIELYRNGNQSLHLQDLSVISVHKQENLKSNINDKKDVTIFEVLNEKQTTADLSELGNNFWLISAERKITKNNPLYKDYFPKDPQPEEIKNKKIINYPTKKYDKSYWFKYVDIKKVPRYHPNNIQLPKLPETEQQQVNSQKVSIQQRNEIQQQIIQSIQQQGSFGFSSVQQEKKKLNQVQQSVPFSQKLLANNQRGGSQQQKQIIVQNQQQIQQQQNALQPQYDADDFVADQEIEQMFAQQSPSKKPQLDWDSQPANNFLIVQHTNSSQVIEQKEKFPILSQKLSYVNQYSHKKEQFSRINDSQNQNRTKISKY